MKYAVLLIFLLACAQAPTGQVVSNISNDRVLSARDAEVNGTMVVRGNIIVDNPSGFLRLGDSISASYLGGEPMGICADQNGKLIRCERQQIWRESVQDYYAIPGYDVEVHRYGIVAGDVVADDIDVDNLEFNILESESLEGEGVAYLCVDRRGRVFRSSGRCI